MSEFDLSIESLKKMIPVRAELSELPDQFTATVTNIAVKSDSRGRRALYFSLVLDDGRQATQKYTSFHISALVKMAEELGIVNLRDMINRRFLFKKIVFRIGNPRWMPVKSL